VSFAPLRTRKPAIDHDEEGSMELKKREGYTLMISSLKNIPHSTFSAFP